MTSLLVLLKPSFPHTVLKGFSKNLNSPFKILIKEGNGPSGAQPFFFPFGLLVPQGKDFNLELRPLAGDSLRGGRTRSFPSSMMREKLSSYFRSGMRAFCATGMET